MATYIGFLRAINLGKNRKFAKDAIVRAVEAAGFTDVETYINTGNVRFDTSMRSRAKIESALEASFAAEAGFAIPTMVFTQAELRAIAEAAASYAHEGKHYVSLLKQEPPADAVRRLEERSSQGEVATVDGRAVHLMVGETYQLATLDNGAVERLLGVATNRNLTVIRALSERWC